ncbi:hypothetical protein WOLCODRAFT_24284 [Wolfiporia cocos MD-104 SS10]|uniref:Uncharacterized protein n=1 Tax=Wolfiporia cocos (strain MD-104) TaxID=742152 RepID=A0A2H3JF22_WOLCO|nr:hypothetical protein WOLCODRAFT_24284 [Wolfiporia cocos MD-104 SS10]
MVSESARASHFTSDVQDPAGTIVMFSSHCKWTDLPESTVLRMAMGFVKSRGGVGPYMHAKGSDRLISDCDI